MAYIGTPINKTITNGVLVATVNFSNSETGDSFNFDFSTTQANSETWLQEQIQIKLNHLNALPDVLNNIQLGTPIEPTQSIIASSPYEQYRTNLKTFQQMVNAIQQGIITKDNPDFIALKAQLSADFSIEYIDLF